VIGRFLCRLGLHRWTTVVGFEGDRYLQCRRCGRYGGEPPAVWKYEE
jgi:hypothetical protein